jgi:hypothetical protein
MTVPTSEQARNFSLALRIAKTLDIYSVYFLCHNDAFLLVVLARHGECCSIRER